MKKIKVNLGKNSYYYYFGSGIAGQLPRMLSQPPLAGSAFIIIDKNAARYHLDYIKQSVEQLPLKTHYLIMEPGERSKSWKQLNKIYEFLLNNNADRHSVIIAAGGGVTGDLAGYAASTFMRGISLVHLPTTLLAMVDSSIGGKTGINFLNKKNMIGTFHQPKFVLADTRFLTSLPKAEVKSGAGEILKYAFLVNEEIYGRITSNIQSILNLDAKPVSSVIPLCAAVKAAVVSKDEYEGGVRKILNLGHTFGHGIESELKFKIKHGEAVTAGLAAALFLSNRLKIISADALYRHLDVLRPVELSADIASVNVENIYNIMLNDKKNKNGKIKFVLPAAAGSILIDIEAGKRDIIKSLESAAGFITKK